MSAIGSDDDIPDPLEHKPLGFCAWCDARLFYTETVIGDPEESRFQEWDCPSCTNWDESCTEEQNRTRYAEEALDDAYTEGRIIGDQRKYGAGREV